MGSWQFFKSLITITWVGLWPRKKNQAKNMGWKKQGAKNRVIVIQKGKRAAASSLFWITMTYCAAPQNLSWFGQLIFSGKGSKKIHLSFTFTTQPIYPHRTVLQFSSKKFVEVKQWLLFIIYSSLGDETLVFRLS